MKKKILALVGVGLLLCMYLVNLVLALIGSPAARQLLLISSACTVLIPLILYGFFIAAGGNRKRYEQELQEAEGTDPGKEKEDEESV